jgi:hypothetical protein
MIEMLEEYICNHWHKFQIPFSLPSRLSYLFIKGFRKAIFLVFKDNDSHPFAVLKVSNDPLAFERIEKEHAILSYLATRGWLKGSVPVSLALFEMEGHQCLLESTLEGVPMVYAIKGIKTMGEKKKMREIFRMVVDILIQLSHGKGKNPGKGHGPAVIEHGDFNPSNLFISRDCIKIFDWEYSKLNGTPLHDLLDFSLKYVLFARYLKDKNKNERPALNDFKEVFLFGKTHSEIIWEYIYTYCEALDINKSLIQDIFFLFSRKYLGDPEARAFSENLGTLLY